jgi:hypothetical protein
MDDAGNTEKAEGELMPGLFSEIMEDMHKDLVFINSELRRGNAELEIALRELAEQRGKEKAGGEIQ